VDRLDPSKNQIIGFCAFGRLLELRPDLCRNVRFLAFLIPSRTDLSVYRNYRDAVYAMIDEVNTRFAADCEGEPIQVFYTNDREQALAAMEQCDVLLVNSREDGMNLVVKEWAVVSQRPGVAVISETAGVAAAALRARSNCQCQSVSSSQSKWRRGELNPCPRRYPRKHLHVYPVISFKEPNVAPAHCRLPSVHEFLHHPARSLRRLISLLSTFGAVAGVQLQTSRSIKPRERDLGDLRLFVLVRFLTRPTNHPRHAACASNDESKPVRPLFVLEQIQSIKVLFKLG
jgi:hypothetical protein